MLGVVGGSGRVRASSLKEGAAGARGPSGAPVTPAAPQPPQGWATTAARRRHEVQFRRLRAEANPRARGAFGPQTHRCGRPQALAPRTVSSSLWVFTFAQTSGLNSRARRDSTLPRAKRRSRPHTAGPPSPPQDPRSTGEQAEAPQLRRPGKPELQPAPALPAARLRVLDRPQPRGSRASRGGDARPPGGGPGGAHSSWGKQVRFRSPSNQPETSVGTSGHQALGAFASFGSLCPFGNHLKGPLPSQEPRLCTFTTAGGYRISFNTSLIDPTLWGNKWGDQPSEEPGFPSH